MKKFLLKFMLGIFVLLTVGIFAKAAEAGDGGTNNGPYGTSTILPTYNTRLSSGGGK